MTKKNAKILLIIFLSIVGIVLLFPVAIICGGLRCGVSNNYNPMAGGSTSITYRVKPYIVFLFEHSTGIDSHLWYFDYTDHEVFLK